TARKALGARDAAHSLLANAIRHRLDAITAQKSQRELLNVRDVESEIERDASFAKCFVEVQRGAAEDAGGAATEVTDGFVGHRVANLMRDHVVANVLAMDCERNWIAGVMTDE